MERVCETCGAPVVYGGIGRPPRYCPDHQNHARNACSMRSYYAHSDGLEDDGSPRACAHCGETYTPKSRKRSTYCSRGCNDQARKARMKRERLADKATLERFCALCEQPIPATRRADSAYCSDLCSQRSHGGLRNRYRKSKVHRELLARDGNRCGICSQRIDMRKKWPHPRSASADHIVPVSVGGSDELANLRLVHLSCNCARGAAMLDEQLAIV